MYGFNVGVSMTYLQVVSLLQKGLRAFASKGVYGIDVISSDEDAEADEIPVVPKVAPVMKQPDLSATLIEVPDVGVSALPSEDATDAVLRAADEYLAKVDAAKSGRARAIEVVPTPSYDFASLYGLQSTKEIQTPARPVIEKPESVREVKPEVVPVEQKPQFVSEAHPVSEVQRTQSVPEVHQTVAQSNPVIEKPAASVERTATVYPPVPDLSGMTLKGQAQAIGKWTTTPVMSEEVLFEAFGKSVILKLVSEGYLVRTKKGIVLGS